MGGVPLYVTCLYFRRVTSVSCSNGECVCSLPKRLFVTRLKNICRSLAFAMSVHDRLGVESPARILCVEPLMLVLHYVGL